MVFPWIPYLADREGVIGVDEMADNYIKFDVYVGTTAVIRSDDIGYNRGETVTKLVHNTGFDDTVARSLHLVDDSTAYQNNSGQTAYAIVTVSAVTDSAADRAFKIYSAPTTDSVAAATEVFDSTDLLNASTAFDNPNDRATSWQVPIQDTHYIVIENTSGASSRNINIPNTEGVNFALVIEQA